MKINFTINWGYQYLYSRKHYHPVFVWDGNLSVTNGKIESVYKLDYPYIWTGIPHSPKETKLSGAEWRDKTKREFSGIRRASPRGLPESCSRISCPVNRPDTVMLSP